MSKDEGYSPYRVSEREKITFNWKSFLFKSGVVGAVIIALGTTSLSFVSCVYHKSREGATAIDSRCKVQKKVCLIFSNVNGEKNNPSGHHLRVQDTKSEVGLDFSSLDEMIAFGNKIGCQEYITGK